MGRAPLLFRCGADPRARARGVLRGSASRLSALLQVLAQEGRNIELIVLFAELVGLGTIHAAWNPCRAV